MEILKKFPDGTKVDDWFFDYTLPKKDDYNNKFIITDYGILSDGKIYTEKFQNLINNVSENGGGLIVVPKGEFLTGALFFKQGVSLYIEEGGVLKGSDYVTDYPIMETRIEGQTCDYLPALINADGVDGFALFGEGEIDGNGARSWQAFWHRRKWNPDCTNKDEQRPRLVFISNSKNVVISGLTLKNSHFWTTHLYKCNKVKYFNCKISSPFRKAPSTDAIDIDACADVHIKGCYLAVNDDGVVLKGGKGINANELPENGSNQRILVEDCEFGHCHGVLTCGSESIHNENIVVRNVKVDEAGRLLWLKLRPDTPQVYEKILIENVVGKVYHMLFIHPWTQFFDAGGKELPKSEAHDITIRNCELTCEDFFSVETSEQYELTDFSLKNLKITTAKNNFDNNSIKNLTAENVKIN